MVLDILEDPLIPGSIKRILRTALVVRNTTILELTQEIKDETGIDSNALYLVRQNRVNTFTPSARVETVTQESNGDAVQRYDLSGLTADPPTVLIHNRQITSELNDLVTLIHELSHIRFATFLEVQIQYLATQFPDNLIYEKDGKFYMNEDLYHFLNERYAFQTEYEFMKATLGRYYHPVYQRYESLLRDPQADKEYRIIISNFLLDAYGIRDPKVRGLAPYKLSEIFLGKPFR